MFNNRFLLTKFFMSSFYSKPKQPMLKVVLIIALFYLFTQVTVLNAAIYYVGNTEQYLFYNFMLSNSIVYVLVIYFGITQVSHYFEFGILGHLPITPKKIILSKIVSILTVLLVMSAITQISTLLFLCFNGEWIRLIKSILFIPLSNIFTILLLLFILSLINTFRHYFVNKTTYLIVNILVIFTFTSLLCYLSVQYLAKYLTFKLSKIDFTTWKTLKDSLSYFVNETYEVIIKASFIGELMIILTTRQFSLHFLIILVCMVVISALLFITIIKCFSINYRQNAGLEISQSTSKKVKVYDVKSEWANYLQRELWVINTQAYFKMQLVLGAVLSPILTLILLVCIQTGWISNELSIMQPGYFEIYFTYFILIISCVNNTSGAPFSREGKYYNSFRSLPVSKKKIYFSKVFLASIPSMITVIASFLILTLFGYMNIDTLLMMMIVLMLVYCYNLLTPIYDMLHPSLEWENPSEAVKSNPNVLVSLLIGLPVLFGIIIIHLLLVWLGFPIRLSTLIIMVATLIVTFGIYTALSKCYFQNKIYN